MNAGGVIDVTYILWNDMHFMCFGQKLVVLKELTESWTHFNV